MHRATVALAVLLVTVLPSPLERLALVPRGAVLVPETPPYVPPGLLRAWQLAAEVPPGPARDRGRRDAARWLARGDPPALRARVDITDPRTFRYLVLLQRRGIEIRSPWGCESPEEIAAHGGFNERMRALITERFGEGLLEAVGQQTVAALDPASR